MFEKLGNILQRAQSGDLSEDRASVEECAPHVFIALMDVWVSDGKDAQACARLAREVDVLFERAKQSNDSVFKGMDATSRMAVWGLLNQFTEGKEARRDAEKEARESSEASRRSEATPS